MGYIKSSVLERWGADFLYIDNNGYKLSFHGENLQPPLFIISLELLDFFESQASSL